jgi:hypothetical protein
MTQYAVILGVVFLCNVVPAFAPPTWIVLVFFSLNYQVPGWALVLLGVIGATSGRYILASYFRRYRSKLPASYITNMENASTHLTKSKGHAVALMTLFLFSPLSSAQLFEAAGIMRRIPLVPICASFALGRVVTYSSYVYGSKAIQATSLGELIARNITSPQAIALQIAMIIGLVLLGTIKWQPHEPGNVTTEAAK